MCVSGQLMHVVSAMLLMTLGLDILQLSKTITTGHIAELRGAYCSNALTQVVLQHKLSSPYVLQSESNSPAVLAQPSRCVKSKVKRKSNLLLFSFAQALHGVAICLSSLSSSPLKTEFC